MISAILVLLLLPVLSTAKTRSSKFRPLFSIAYWFLVADFIILGWIGQKPVESPYIEVGTIATNFYFFFLLIFIPVGGIFENELRLFGDKFYTDEEFIKLMELELIDPERVEKAIEDETDEQYDDWESGEYVRLGHKREHRHIWIKYQDLYL
jgi:ubiquinol-cytochrome c reductase cytochrome b subunit